jgi:hypothetical protein
MAGDPQSTWATVVQASAAALSPVIAVVGGWIAWQQVRINRNKLKLDRFEKRFEIYEAAMSFAAKVSSSGSLQAEWTHDFQLKTRGARFLLNKELADYLDEILMKAADLHATMRFLESPTMPESKREALANKWTGLQRWFNDQFKAIPDKFAPFLSVDDL